MPTGHHKTEKRYHVLYRTTCSVTGKFYLGIHSTDDLDDGYLGSGLYLQRSVAKYGREAHSVEHVALFETRAELLAAEKALVSVGGKSMNLVDGGGDPPHRYGEEHHNFGGGSKVSAETREKMRLAKLGKKFGPASEERKAKIGAANRGKPSYWKNRPRSAETKERMRLAQVNRPEWIKRACVVAHLRKNRHYVPMKINLLRAEVENGQ